MSDYFSQWKPEKLQDYIQNLRLRVAMSNYDENHKKEFYKKINSLEKQFKEKEIRKKYRPIIKNALEGISKELDVLKATSIDEGDVIINKKAVRNKREISYWIMELSKMTIELNNPPYKTMIFDN